MSFKNLLDLRKKVQPQVKIVERIIFQKRSIKSDLFLALSVMLVASGIIWGVSKADNSSSVAENIAAFKQMLDDRGIPREERSTFSTRGDIISIDNTTIAISNANNKIGEKGFTFTVDLSLSNIKSYTGEALSLADVKLGQEVVAKGILSGDTITAHTLIIFKDKPLLDVATSTATTTLDISTSTDDVGTSSDDTGISTPSIIDKVKDFVSDIVDTIIGTSTSTTTTEQTGTTTTATTTDSSNENTGAGTSSSVIPAEAGIQSGSSSSTDTNLDPRIREDDNSGSILNSVTNTIGNMTGAVKDAFTNVADIITGNTQTENQNTESTANLPEEDLNGQATPAPETAPN